MNRGEKVRVWRATGGGGKNRNGSQGINDGTPEVHPEFGNANLRSSSLIHRLPPANPATFTNAKREIVRPAAELDDGRMAGS